jgi:hypothetical protein
MAKSSGHDVHRKRVQRDNCIAKLYVTSKRLAKTALRAYRVLEARPAERAATILRAGVIATMAQQANLG